MLPVNLDYASINIAQTFKAYPDKILHQWFEEQAKKTPNQTAVICNGSSLTYTELNEKVNQLTHYLNSLDIQPDTLIAICLDRSINLIIGILAILKTGAAYVPLDSNLPKERLEFIIANCQATIILTQLTYQDLFPSTSNRICWENIETDLPKFSHENPEKTVEFHNLAYAIFTSGSTGKPKGVMIEHQSICNTIHHFQHELNVQPSDKWLNIATVTFDPSVLDIFLPLVTGATLVIAPPKAAADPAMISTYLHKYGITFLQATPSTLKLLTYHQWHGSPGLAILTGGESLTKDLAEFLIPRCKQLWNLYGPTEISIWATTKHIISSTHEITAGKPIANTELCILDENLQLLSTGEPGELYIGGKGLARGYLNRLDLTKERFIPNPITHLSSKYLYKTGDICTWLPNGELKIIGRVDHQVKIRGFRVELGEIEEVIKSYSGIVDSLVIASGPEAEDMQLLAYYTENISGDVDHTSLRNHLKRFLPDYMIPATLFGLKSFPLNANGKIDRHALPKSTFQHSINYNEPCSPEEQKVKVIWSQVLKVEKISLHDNFFELGGNSLHVVKILSELRNLFHREISIAEFYQYPTIKSFTKTLMTSPETSNIIPLLHPAPHQSILSETQYNLWLLDKFYPLSTTLNIVTVKRLLGKIDFESFQQAVNGVLKKYPILSLHFNRYYPIQTQLETRNLPVSDYDYRNDTTAQQEIKLQESLIELKHFRDWKKGFPLLIIRYFYLGNGVTELHLCIPHIISDLASIDLIYSDLSHYYSNNKLCLRNTHFLSYITSRKNQPHATLKRDLAFWQHHLQDTSHFSMPLNVMIDPAISNKQPCESLIIIPDEIYDHLQVLCTKHNVNITAAISAAVAMALTRHDTSQKAKNRIMTFVRGAMNTEEERIIGNFTHGNIIKFSPDTSLSLMDTAKRIQLNIINTEKYQACFSCVKHTLPKKHSLKNTIIYKLLKHVMAIYLKFLEILYKIKPDYVFFKQYCYLLADTLSKENIKNKLAQEISVTVNILKDFLLPHNKQDLFGCDVLKSEEYVGDGITMPNSLMLVFFRKMNTRYIRIHGDVKSDFRELLGQDILDIIARGPDDFKLENKVE